MDNPRHALVTVREFEAAARAELDPVYFDYVSGGARDEVTLRANEAGFARLGLLPRMLRGNEKRSLETRLLNSRASLPVVVSPTAFHKLMTPEGERATARAAAAADTILITGMAATVAVADVVAAAREAGGDAAPDVWFQLYLQPRADITAELVDRAARAGAAALVVTVDSPVRGAGERNERNGFHDLPPGLACENMRGLGGDGNDRVRSIEMSAALTWEHVGRLRALTDLPIVIKGILHPDDALLALEHGADAIMVSNHGGRQLDGVPATIDLLPGLAEAVSGRAPILLDGGIRRGADVVKALALGATAVGVGRPVLWGLAAGGADGARQVLEILRAEIDHTLALLGADSTASLTPEFVVRSTLGCGVRSTLECVVRSTPDWKVRSTPGWEVRSTSECGLPSTP
ncbi:MAG TPA: alpha-hydroxy acid oxidase, partial [Trebonia sp.]|nr:alpha-hydroxy acid oxidase [Trebonia sp.]